MKQKLFENVGKNRFKLITESIVEDNPKAKLVREGLKKVFSAGAKELSYKRLQGVGMGYIKSVEEAKKTAIQEARELAAEYGYVENESAQTFVKEGDFDDPVDSDRKWDKVPQLPPAEKNSEESREVQIGKKLLSLADDMDSFPSVLAKGWGEEIRSLAQELMHGQK